MEQFTLFFALETSHARHQWLQQHCPVRSETLVKQLWDEAERLERSDPNGVTVATQIAQDLAVVWQDRELEAVAYRIEASRYRALGQHDLALLRYRTAISLYQQLGMTDEAARATVGVIDTLMYLSQYSEALQLAAWAIDQMRRIGDEAVLSRLLVNQGNIYARTGDFAAAQQVYAEASQRFTTLGQTHYLAMVEANEANILTTLNEFRQAEERYRQARSHFAAANLASAVAQVDHNLGYLAFMQGNYQQALHLFSQARSTFSTQQSSIDVAYADLYRAEIYLALNLWPEVLAVARATRPVFEEALMQWESGQLLLIEAAALIQLKHFQTAEALLARAEQIFTAENNHFWVAVTATTQAVLAWHRKELLTARQRLQQSWQTFTATGVASRAAHCAIWLGEIALATGELSEATAQFNAALAMIGSTPLPAITYACHFGLGRIYQRLQATDPAIHHYTIAVADLERAQLTIGAEDYKMAFRQDKLLVYETLILLYLEQNTPDSIHAAFTLVEQAKARGLLDAMARTDETVELDVPDELLAHYETIKQELNWYYHKLHTPPDPSADHPAQQRSWHGTVRQYETNLAELQKRWRHPDLAAAPRNPIWTVSSAEIQQALPPSTLLLEFYTTEQSVLVFGLSHEGMWIRQLSIPRVTLIEQLDKLRFQMNKFSYGSAYRNRHATALLESTNELLVTFYSQLLAPLPEINAFQQLIIVPHGLLHYIPFHALRDRDHYLLETHALSYAPSATVLHRVLTNHYLVPQDPPLIFGVTDASIPQVEAEIAGLRDLFPTAHIYCGPEATTTKLLAETWRPPFLHISTHAMFRSDNPDFSSLKLADKWLSVKEIYHLATAAPLVTLSACETGRNEIKSGDELIGLCRGFFSIGTQALVVSLWRVEDQTTADLMLDFYAALKSGLPVYHALRKAQLALLARHPHPYYWAPFLLTGNPLLQLSL